MASTYVIQAKKGALSHSILVYLKHDTTKAGLPALAFDTASLKIIGYRAGAAAVVDVTPATQTVNGAFSSGGFVKIDDTNFPGLYRFDVPDALLADATSNLARVSIVFKGAANLEETVYQIDLVSKGMPKGIAVAKFPFLVRDSSTKRPVTGKTVTCTRSLDGAAFAATATAAATEIGNGVYYIPLAAADMLGDIIQLRATVAAGGCEDTFVLIRTEV